MGKHTVSKWERATEHRQIKKGTDNRHFASYQFKKGDSRRRRVQAHCFVCNGDHSWEDGCD